MNITQKSVGQRAWIKVLVLCIALGSASSAWAQSAGGGISVFIPETLYRYKKGTIAFEQGFSTSIGLGSLLSIPMGFSYHSADGYVLEKEGSVTAQNGPSLYGDALIPYLMGKVKVPLGTLYVEAFGGVGGVWAFSLKPTGEFFAPAIGSSGTTAVALGNITVEQGFGFGWMAGGSLGVQIGAIGVDLSATYRDLGVPMKISGTYYEVSGTTATERTVAIDDAKAILRGISINLGGSYKIK